MKRNVKILCRATLCVALLSVVASPVLAGPVRDRLRVIADAKQGVYQQKKAIYNTAKWLEGNLAGKTATAYDAYVNESDSSRKQAKYQAWLRVSRQYQNAKRQTPTEHRRMVNAHFAWMQAERAWQNCPPGK